MIRHGIEIPEARIADLCRKHKIRKLSLFGSILTDDFGPDSDIDVLVEFEPDARVGLFEFGDIERALAEMLDRKVDLKTAGFLSKYFRDRVVAEAEAVYAA